MESGEDVKGLAKDREKELATAPDSVSGIGARDNVGKAASVGSAEDVLPNMSLTYAPEARANVPDDKAPPDFCTGSSVVGCPCLATGSSVMTHSPDLQLCNNKPHDTTAAIERFNKERYIVNRLKWMKPPTPVAALHRAATNAANSRLKI